jgi:hypothetical protein
LSNIFFAVYSIENRDIIDLLTTEIAMSIAELSIKFHSIMDSLEALSNDADIDLAQRRALDIETAMLAAPIAGPTDALALLKHVETLDADDDRRLVPTVAKVRGWLEAQSMGAR